FRAQRTNLKKTAPVTALLPIKNAYAKSLLLEVVECLRDFEWRGIRKMRKNGLLNFISQSFDSFAPRDLPAGVKGSFNSIAGNLVRNLQKIVANIQKSGFPFRFAGNSSKFPLHFDDFADKRMRKFQGANEIFFGQFVGGALDHHDVVRRTDVD